MKSRDEKRWKLVNKTAKRYARVFGLRLWKVRPLGKKTAGLCWFDGKVCISLRDKDGLRDSHFVLDTIAHELAHLAFFNHCEEWVRLFAKILLCMAEDKMFDKFRRRW
jgi:predicted SprT family Zn-dependent metalloprotease